MRFEMPSLSVNPIGAGCETGYVRVEASGFVDTGTLGGPEVNLSVCVPDSAWIVQQLRPNGYEQIQTRIVSDPLLQWVMAVQVITLVLVVALMRMKR
jgi:hypothetical protein